MKKVFLAFLFFSLLFFNSCSNLEEEVTIQLTEDNFFEQEGNIEAIKDDVYTYLGPFVDVGGVFGLQEISSDEFARIGRGMDWGQDDWYDLHLHSYGTFQPSSIDRTWDFLYWTIYRINEAIGLIEGGKTEVDKRPVLAELKTLRALFYYWLIDLFGNVPIITQFEADPNPSTQDRAVVFDFIEKELLESLPFLSQRVDIATYGKVNYYVAQTILAKLYLNAEIYKGATEWQKTIQACDAVINSGYYQLEEDFFENFKIENESSTENIFVIPYDHNFMIGFFLGANTLHPLSQKTFNLDFQPWNGYASIQEFYNSFDQNDDRINSFIVGPQYEFDGVTPLLDPLAEENDPDGQPVNFTPFISSMRTALRQEGARVGKFEITRNDSEGGLVGRASMDNDFPIYRYADVIMMKAEALWRLNSNDQDALILVNQIRARSKADLFTELNEELLLAERGREFFCEAWRRSDLIRFGKYNEPWWEKPPDPSDHVNVFPIPYDALVNNPNLRQNPGY